MHGPWPLPATTAVPGPMAGSALTSNAYGMTIASTAESGGGLPDLGVFAKEKVYTVFLDMRVNSGSYVPRSLPHFTGRDSQV